MYAATMFGVAIGIVAGIPLAFFAEILSRRFKRKSFLRHIFADLRNGERHFSLVNVEAERLSEETSWRRKSRLNWMTFSSRGFLSHSSSEYYLLKQEELDELTITFVYMDNFDKLCLALAETSGEDQATEALAISEIKKRSEKIRSRCQILLKALEPRIGNWSFSNRDFVAAHKKQTRYRS